MYDTFCLLKMVPITQSSVSLMTALTDSIDLGFSLCQYLMHYYNILPDSRFQECFRVLYLQLIYLFFQSYLDAVIKHFHFSSCIENHSFSVKGFRVYFCVFLSYSELQNYLPSLYMLLFHLYYYYLAIPNQQLVGMQLFRFLYYLCIHYIYKFY